MAARKEVVKAYPAFRKQNPRPPPQEHETPNDGCTMREEPTPLVEGSAPATILLLVPNKHRITARIVGQHNTSPTIPKQKAPETHVAPVRYSD